MPPHPSTDFEIQRYYQNKPRLNVVFSGNNLPKKIKDGTYVINLDEYADVARNWFAYFVTEMKLLMSIVSVLNMFLEKLKNFWGIKT